MFLAGIIHVCHVRKAMNQKIKYIGMLAILPLFAFALTTGFVEDADAQKSQGNPTNKSGSETALIVCGGVLCSTPEGSEDPVNVGKAQ